MEDVEDLIDETNEPLNPYAKVFFGLWVLVALALASFQSFNSPHEKSTQPWHPTQQTVQTVHLKQTSLSATAQLSFIESIR